MDGTGNLYGTTVQGGTGPCTVDVPPGCGTVFKLNSSGNETVLHSFTYSDGDGAYPYATLVMDAAGNLYGTTAYGGASGYGTVFKLDPSGNETVLHSFTSSTDDGGVPQAGLLMDQAGNLYGTTNYGGTGTCNAYISGCGTVFKVDASGNTTVLHEFTNSSGDGGVPLGSLIMDKEGNLYGTTSEGGASSNCSMGCGTVFKVDASGNETILYSFTATPDGQFPASGLIMDTAGNLYGTTDGGGASGLGTVFELNSSGNETVLHSFTYSDGDGAYPYATLVMDAAGNLYGTTVQGGASGYGTVFKLDPSGNETVLHSFTSVDGTSPYAGLAMDTAGNLYGTTSQGGAYGYGTVFRIALGPSAQIANLQSTVLGLVTAGKISTAIGRFLLAPLNAALAAINAGHATAAIGELDGFILEVRLLVILRRLTSAEGNTLIQAASSIITSLRG